MMDNLLAPVCVPDRQNEQHERVQFRQNLSAVLIANPQMSIGLGLCDGDAMFDGCCLQLENQRAFTLGLRSQLANFDFTAT